MRVEYLDCKNLDEISRSDLFKPEDIINIETRVDYMTCPNGVLYRVWYKVR